MDKEPMINKYLNIFRREVLKYLHYRPNEYKTIILKTLNCMIPTQATNFVVMDCYHYCSVGQQKLFQQCTIVVWCRMPTMCNSQPTMATIQSGTTTLQGPVSITTERDCTTLPASATNYTVHLH